MVVIYSIYTLYTQLYIIPLYVPGGLFIYLKQPFGPFFQDAQVLQISAEEPMSNPATCCSMAMKKTLTQSLS